MGGKNCVGTRRCVVALVFFNQGKQRRTGAHHDDGTGQKPDRGARRNRLCGFVCALVCRRSAADWRRCADKRESDAKTGRVETACRRYRRDYAVELPVCDDCAQGRACFGGGLRDDRQTCIAHAPERVCAGLVGLRSGHAAGFTSRCQRSRFGNQSWICHEPDRAQNQLHRFDRSRRENFCRQRGGH